MKKIAKGIHRLGQRAAEIRQVVEAMPAQAAEFREAVTATAGQMRQLRTDLKAVVPPLLPTNESAALAQLREVEEAGDVLAEAGFLLGGIDWETGLVRRIRVHLHRAEAVTIARLRALLAAHAHQPTCKALLSGIVQAVDLAEQADLAELDFAEVVVELGSGQGVRIGWRAPAPAAPSVSAATTLAEPRPPAFAQSSFFAQPAAVPVAPVAIAPTASASPAAPPAPLAATATALPPNWRASALDRFKKMPDLSKSAPR